MTAATFHTQKTITHEYKGLVICCDIDHGTRSEHERSTKQSVRRESIKASSAKAAGFEERDDWWSYGYSNNH
jgi:hypothetical protein